MAALADELADDIEHNGGAFHGPARHFAEDISREVVAMLVDAVDLPGRCSVRIEGHSRAPMTDPLGQPTCLHLGCATAADACHHGAALGRGADGSREDQDEDADKYGRANKTFHERSLPTLPAWAIGQPM